MFKRRGMTQKEMEKLADIVVTKLLMVLSNVHPHNLDDQEQDMIKEVIMGGTTYEITEEEMLMGELARLQTILMIYEDKEEYEKASVIMEKISRVKYKLSKI